MLEKLVQELMAPRMNAMEPSVKCYLAIPMELLLLQRRSRGRNRNIEMGMVLLCSLLRLMVRWSQGLTAPKTTTQLSKIW